MSKQLYRRCRSAACRKWSMHPPVNFGKNCPFCKAPFGPLELGLDTTQAPDQWVMPQRQEGEA